MCIISRILDLLFHARTRVCITPSRKVQVLFNKILASHLKKSQEITHSYGIRFHAGRETGQYDSYPEIYWETQFGFVLYVRSSSTNVPVAFIGFDKKSTYLLVRQVQGVLSMKEYLRPLHYEQLLYRTVILFGQELGVKEIRVIPSFLSDYNPLKNDQVADKLSFAECGARAMRFHLIYDKAPQKCGFRWVERTRTYTFALS